MSEQCVRERLGVGPPFEIVVIDNHGLPYAVALAKTLMDSIAAVWEGEQGYRILFLHSIMAMDAASRLIWWRPSLALAGLGFYSPQYCKTGQLLAGHIIHMLEQTLPIIGYGPEVGRAKPHVDHLPCMRAFISEVADEGAVRAAILEARKPFSVVQQ